MEDETTGGRKIVRKNKATIILKEAIEEIQPLTSTIKRTNQRF
jgi:hypothetical protein